MVTEGKKKVASSRKGGVALLHQRTGEKREGGVGERERERELRRTAQKCLCVWYITWRRPERLGGFSFSVDISLGGCRGGKKSWDSAGFPLGMASRQRRARETWFESQQPFPSDPETSQQVTSSRAFRKIIEHNHVQLGLNHAS